MIRLYIQEEGLLLKLYERMNEWMHTVSTSLILCVFLSDYFKALAASFYN